MSQGKVSIENLHFTPLFGNVSCGQFFVYRNELCVRTGSNNKGEWEAFGFVCKAKFHIPHTKRVNMVDCELQYEYCVLTKAEL